MSNTDQYDTKQYTGAHVTEKDLFTDTVTCFRSLQYDSDASNSRGSIPFELRWKNLWWIVSQYSSDRARAHARVLTDKDTWDLFYE